MATISISNLDSIGSELFSDSKTYLRDLNSTELQLQGQAFPLVAVGIAMGVGMVIAGAFVYGALEGAHGCSR